jgi:hypothetical protein
MFFNVQFATIEHCSGGRVDPALTFMLRCSGQDGHRAFSSAADSVLAFCFKLFSHACSRIVQSLRAADKS